MIKNKQSAKNIILNIIIIALCIILFLFTIAFIGETVEYNKVYTYNGVALLRYIEHQQYTELTDAVYENEANGVFSAKMEEMYAIAHYYHNAVLYYAYQNIGDTQQAQIKYEKMQEYEAKLGEYAYVKDEILSNLEAED